MGFSRFLNNKPLDLSGIKQFTPDLNQAEKTLDNITTGYDEVQALSNAIPEYLQGDSQAMRDKQDEYRAGIQNAANAYANQGAQAGNALLRNMKSTIQSDFSTTGEVYGMGNNFKETEKTKAALKEAGVSGEMYNDYLENNIPSSSYDENGNFVRYVAPGSLPTVPNYSERALKYGKESLPTITELDTVITDKAGNITGIQKNGQTVRTIDELVDNISNLMDGDNDVINSQQVYGDSAVRMKRKAIEGAVKSYYQFDTKTTISNLNTGNSANKNAKNVTDTTFEFKSGATVTTQSQVVRKEQIVDGEVIENKDVYENISNLLESSKDVSKDILNIGGKSNADQTLVSTIVNYYNLPDDNDPYEITYVLPSDDYGTSGVNREEGILDYTLGKLMQDPDYDYDNPFFTGEEKITFDDTLSVWQYKKDLATKMGLTVDELHNEITKAGLKYDELELTQEYDKLVAKADAVVQNRNGLINRKKAIDKETRKETMKEFGELGRRYLDGDFENMTTNEKIQLAREMDIDTKNSFSSSDSKTQKLIRAQDIEDEGKADVASKQKLVDDAEAELAEQEAKIDAIIDNKEDPSQEDLVTLNLIKNRLSGYNTLLTNADNKSKKTFARADRIREEVKKVEEDLKEEKAKATPDKTKVKILENFLNDNTPGIIKMEEQIIKSMEGKYEETKQKKQEEILENMYANQNYDLATFTSLLRTGEGLLNLQDPPGRTDKLNNLQETEHYHAAGIGASGSGLKFTPALDLHSIEIFTNDSTEAISKEKIAEDNIVGVSYRATGIDPQGNYIMTGFLQKLEGKGKDARVVTTDIGVTVYNEMYNKDFQKLSHSGNPTAIKPHTDNLLNKLAASSNRRAIDTGFIGDMYAIQIKEDSNGKKSFTIHDQIGKDFFSKVGKQVSSKQPFTDSFDLAQKLAMIRTEVVANGTTRSLGPAGTYDKELKVENLANYEDGFGRATNIKFSPTESIERKALDKEFGTQFIEVFGNFKSDVIVTSMLRSLDNQKKLNADYEIFNKQLVSGHLLGEGIDVSATNELISEFIEKFGGVKKFNKAFKDEKGNYKEDRVEFGGMSILIHGSKNQGLHLDIKKINK